MSKDCIHFWGHSVYVHTHKHTHTYRVFKKLLYTLWLQCKNTQEYFKQFQSLTMITYLELGITDGVGVSLVPSWPSRSAAKQSDWGGTLWTLLVTFCIVTIRCTENFNHPVFINIYSYIYIDKGKAIPLQACTGPEGSRRHPDFKTIDTWRY
jgi:hypothetical protein